MMVKPIDDIDRDRLEAFRAATKPATDEFMRALAEHWDDELVGTPLPALLIESGQEYHVLITLVRRRPAEEQGDG